MTFRSYNSCTGLGPTLWIALLLLPLAVVANIDRGLDTSEESELWTGTQAE
jgi:hypothetical protein